MKLAKMSLVAALLLGANVYAIDNVKVNGDARMYYETVDTDAANAPDMFDKDASGADFALRLGVTADLSEGVSAGATFNAVSTLGIENNLVSGVWSGAHDATPNAGADLGAQVDDASFFSEAWIAGTAGKTTAKVGRQALDTPLAFTETWSITDNTFEAIVLLNQDLPDTTLVGTYIGKANGLANDINPGAGLGYITSNGGKFNSFYDGVYAFGAVNNSFKPVTAQAWYYDLKSLAKAYWLQADLDMDGILAGVQYTNISADAAGAKDDTAYAVMLGYAMKDVVTIKAAYSSVDDEGTLGVANVATGTSNGGQTKLYTEMWWWYGTVSATGADSIALSAEGTVGDGYDLYLGYWNSEIDVLGTANDYTVDEIAFTVSRSYGPLDTTVALLWDDIDNEVGADETITTLQLYLTYNF